VSLFKPLLQKLNYLNRPALIKVYQAYRIANAAHLGQQRETGEAYITHPLAVASILADMHLDYESLIAALLHDVIEDTSLTKESVKEKFGNSIAELVDGVTKLMQIHFSSKAEAQAESFRKMVLAMSRDIRVILIKLADRMHNMQTLHGLHKLKRQRIARETLDIYAPIANRLGIHNLSIQLESLAFVELYPRRYEILKAALEKVRGNRQEIIERIEKELSATLTKSNLDNVKILSRTKHLYGIYKKMRKDNLSFTEIMDVYGFRIIVNSKDECYRTLGAVHSVYKPIPGKFKDYIAIPKYNGYQSLHTKLCGPYGIPIEIQIRTTEMDQVANSGIAAHWFYKAEEGNKFTDSAHIRAQQWVNNLLEIQKSTGSSLEFVESVKVDLFPDEVYVFTPKGEIMELPRGATVVDFAYAIHTDIGNKCAAARIDQQFAPLSTVLTNGQTVVITKARTAKPNPAWLNFVVTSKARSNIRNFLRGQRRCEAIALGRELLSDAMSELKLSMTQIDTTTIAKVLKELKLENVDDLYENIGLGDRLAIFIAHQIAATANSPEAGTKASKDSAAGKKVKATNETGEAIVTAPHKPKPLLIKNAEGVAITFAPCCTPVPGDAIVGYFNIGHGLEVHTEGCPKLNQMRIQAEKYLPVQWADDVKGEFRAAINVEMSNQRGSLARLAQTISDAGSSIDDISMSECNSGYCMVSLKLMVRNTDHLETVLQSISALPIVVGVIRKK
jgi:GTP diphosphokinase / guanosine-3',5'-bis(diphosphate) 3'-diphosphatase